MQEIIKSENTNAITAGNSFNIPTGYICTFDLESLAGKLKLASALNGAITMKDKTGEVLRVTDFVTTPGVRSRTGEVCKNVYLICDDDTVYFTQSDGIARCVAVIVGTFTDKNTGAYTNPVSLGVGCKVLEDKLDNGNTLKKLLPVALAE